MKFYSLIVFCFTVFFSFSQNGEGVEAMTGNSELWGTPKMVLKSTGTFDSTFIYTTDTLSLPIFDDFTLNRIQKYEVDFSDPGVTFDKKYKLLDVSDVPLDAALTYTPQVTFRRTYDVVNNTTVDVNFPAELIKIGNLANYPVVYSTTSVYPPFYIYDTIGQPDVSDTVWIVSPSVYQDSATQFFAQVSDPQLFWLDDNAYHNYRYAVNPWSLGVMTFDGLDRTGYPYAIGTTLSDYADYLTSKPIDLSGSAVADSLYITFLIQKKGFGDQPEATDSLVLEFYDSAAQLWIHQWGVNGGALDEFQVAQVPVKTVNFLTDAFQFRFKNYGGLSGALDHFHLDYVKFRDFSGYQDTLIEDFALSYPIASLLNEFTSVPWDHYKNNPVGKMSTEVPVTLRNSYLNGGASISSTGGGKIKVSYNNVQEGLVNLNGQLLANYNPPTQPIPDYTPRTTFSSVHDVSTYSFDPSKPGVQQFFDVELNTTVPIGSNYRQNDTARSVQYFGNYYSYDDGTAEQAYGPQGFQSRLAIQYTPYEADSIIGMMVHFVPTVNDVSNKLFQMAIWDDNGGVPGALLYEDNAFFARQPRYESSPNKFVTYFTKDTVKVPVTGTFYIGWKQIDSDRLGVGLDKNIDRSQHTFFNADGGSSWTMSSIEGSVMLRPIFSTSFDPALGVRTIAAVEPTISIYPNPSTGVFNVNSDRTDLGDISVFSIQGQHILTTTESSFDLSNYSSGVYFVKSSTSSKTLKITKH